MIQKGKLESIVRNYRKHPEGSQKVLLLESSLSNNQLSVLTPLNFPQPETTQTFWTTNWAQIFSRTVRFFSLNRRGWKSYSVLNNWKASEHPLLTHSTAVTEPSQEGEFTYVNTTWILTSEYTTCQLYIYQILSNIGVYLPLFGNNITPIFFLCPVPATGRVGAEQYDFHILLAAFYCCFPISSKMSLR